MILAPLLSLLLPAVLAAGPAPVAVLHDWDHRRSEAWSRGDPSALADLYTAHSAAGRADVAMLRDWRARGLRLEGLEVQLLRVEVLRREPRLLRLDVTDRVAAGVAVPGGLALPLDQPSRHLITLRLVAGEWRVASVRPPRS